MEVDTRAGAAPTRTVTRAHDARGSLQRHIGPGEWSTVIGPTAFFLVAVGLLSYDHVKGRVSELAFWVGLGVIVIVFTWLLLRAGRATSATTSQRLDSLRDQLTGLGNSAALRADLGSALTERRPMVLFALELETLTTDEDRPDQLTGERQAIQVGEELAATAAELTGTAYRLDGRRFALLAAATGEATEVVAGARAAFVRDRQSSLASAHVGEVVLPDDAGEVELALRLADQRLVASKRHGFRSTRRQAHAALLAALDSRRPQLRAHLRSVVPRVIAVGRQLGLDREQLDDIVLAAGLQDIGMLTVPEAMLEQPGPLSADQRALLREHPIAGERIVGAASSLTSVAKLVRSAYERYDGSGYPDGLRGEEIPLGARIIAPCVALAAMTSPRPHRPALGPEEAVAELRDGAGSQFDPEVVEVLVAELTAELQPPPAPTGGIAPAAPPGPGVPAPVG